MKTSLIDTCLGVDASYSDCALTYLGGRAVTVRGTYSEKPTASVKKQARARFYNELSGIELRRRMALEKTRHNIVLEMYVKNIEQRLKQGV